ncbi:phage adaptor protein [Maritalea porphyrae]|uniref:phage adaptor protein n=1 Tax=Maritalea porphyrae TaxID=880732 RepID=UPI0022B0247B|nr:hypothetical protein [Maritalea porphyrae]MCZ4270894.1 hypothetical protein [Maritalea porphyrae]
MALITDYDTLKTAVALYQWRTDDTAFENNVDSMIQNAGARLNRKLQLRVMQVNTDLTGTIGSREIALPSDYVEPISLHLTTFGEPCELRPSIAGQMPLHTGNASPDAWCIDGTNISLDHPCDVAHTFRFRYRKSLVLDATTTTNWLLTNHPDIYLAAVCVWGGVFMRDQEEAVKHKALLEEGLEELGNIESRNTSIAPLTVDAALVSRGGFNINNG